MMPPFPNFYSPNFGINLPNNRNNLYKKLNPTPYFPKSLNENSKKKSSNFSKTNLNYNNRKKFDSFDNSFDFFGLNLYFDDILIIFLLIFLYNEDVKDTYLYIALLMLLLS